MAGSSTLFGHGPCRPRCVGRSTGGVRRCLSRQSGLCGGGRRQWFEDAVCRMADPVKNALFFGGFDPRAGGLAAVRAEHDLRCVGTVVYPQAAGLGVDDARPDGWTLEALAKLRLRGAMDRERVVREVRHALHSARTAAVSRTLSHCRGNDKGTSRQCIGGLDSHGVGPGHGRVGTSG